MRGFIDLDQRAAIKFAYASMSDGFLFIFSNFFNNKAPIQTFSSFYRSSSTQERINEILRTIFEEILGRFYAVSQVIMK